MSDADLVDGKGSICRVSRYVLPCPFPPTSGMHSLGLPLSLQVSPLSFRVVEWVSFLFFPSFPASSTRGHVWTSASVPLKECQILSTSLLCPDQSWIEKAVVWIEFFTPLSLSSASYRSSNKLLSIAYASSNLFLTW